MTNVEETVEVSVSSIEQFNKHLHDVVGAEKIVYRELHQRRPPMIYVGEYIPLSLPPSGNVGNICPPAPRTDMSCHWDGRGWTFRPYQMWRFVEDTQQWKFSANERISFIFPVGMW